MHDDHLAQWSKLFTYWTGLPKWISAKEAKWEATAVRKVLKGLGLGSVHQVTTAAEEITGEPAQRLSFVAFDRAYEGMPIRFAAARVQGHRLRVFDGRFGKTILWAAYQRELDLPDERARPLALIFPWAEVRTMVLHLNPLLPEWH